ncbi:shikimate dehydrogenase [Rivibacter subsaxonicus]|uniref:Shikimate dehydrogenase (NADP(+)) n=1 Tax=Rivibacter subsaxonicus TaxID=457575 RepID=A0A4Q7VGD0_9BURK|nr:shikimate dehydrogenase [Rivibacter subsaxonicus]RZT95081.1 shikimate dehydrogenase [Rivibacter subsaxonicus]
MPSRQQAPAAAVDRYVVIGHPVEHSRSPFIHARFAEQTGERLHYGRLPCAPDAFAATLRGFADSTSELGPARGCNVTVPFKFEAPALAATLSTRARLAGAVNTLRFDAGGWAGDNTDGVGLVRDITRNAGVAIAGRSVLLLGAGGAAAGVLGPVLEARPARIVIANRSPERARALVQSHAALAQAQGVSLGAAPLDACGRGFDIVLNATAASLGGQGVPVDAAVLARGALALDLMYGPAARPFLDWAREHDAHGRDGLGMLVEQAAEAFEFWRGVRPDTAPVLAALRAEVDAESAR